MPDSGREGEYDLAEDSLAKEIQKIGVNRLDGFLILMDIIDSTKRKRAYIATVLFDYSGLCIDFRIVLVHSASDVSLD